MKRAIFTVIAAAWAIALGYCIALAITRGLAA